MGLHLNKSAALGPEKSRSLHFRKGMTLISRNPMNHKPQRPASASSQKLFDFNKTPGVPELYARKCMDHEKASMSPKPSQPVIHPGKPLNLKPRILGAVITFKKI